MKLSKQTERELASLIYSLSELTVNQAKQIYFRYVTEAFAPERSKYCGVFRIPDDLHECDLDEFEAEVNAEAVYILQCIADNPRHIIAEQIPDDGMAWLLWASFFELVCSLRNTFYLAIRDWLDMHGGNSPAYREFSPEIESWCSEFGERIFQFYLQGEVHKEIDFAQLAA